MKSVLFDVDGVFLSEERCFDVSALTVYEMLMSQSYLGLDPSIQFDNLSDKQIKEIRAIVFYHDDILTRLKSLGLNSNWDMLFIVIALHFIEVCKSLPRELQETVLDDKLFNQQTLQNVGAHATDVSLDFSAPLTFLDGVKAGKDNIYQALVAHANEQLDTQQGALFELKSPFWFLSQEIYQEWYLGHQLYSEVEQKTNRTTFKEGYIYNEVVLRPVAEIKQLLIDLKAADYHIAIATGRPRTETIVPFEALGIKSLFDEHYIGTASEVLIAEDIYPELKPLGKPNPFSYLIALDGNDQNNYKHYATNQTQRVKKDEVFIVGDSLADLLSAKTIGATFIGPLTGLKGQAARAELEANGADYIVDHVGDIRNILL
ncbi:HAD family hydrolase [Staphylococcus caeli]|uniref:HAD family hydrolase n=1 Tax=Staphylococcus caeli TaxID=2201815 RepID=UPI003F5488B0